MSRSDDRPVLVIDDDPELRTVIALALEAHGVPAVGAEDGVEALRILGQGPVRLILLDLMMPRMDGVQFLRALGPSRQGEAPVVIFSADPAAPEIARAVHADGCLAKPVELDTLLATVDRLTA